jgi:hypothetical protein
MVATWTGDKWNLLSGGLMRPEQMVFWNYVTPAAPPTSIEADHRKNAMLVMRRMVERRRDDLVHEHFAHDLETGAWESSNELLNSAVELMDDILSDFDQRIASEFPVNPNPDPQPIAAAARECGV